MAAEVVARDGMHAASTAEIAKRSGISHAYLFRLFPTKEELLMEVSHRCGDAMHQAMLRAGQTAKANGADPLVAMGVEWTNQLNDHTNLLVSLQSITASRSIPALGDHLREAWGEVVDDIARISGASADEVRAFIAQGMLLQVISALGAEETPWVSWLHDGPLPCGPVAADDPDRVAKVTRTVEGIRRRS
ncbi:MAG: TetR/AcrR family transcriptional regulator [Solirubrobacteraceae bacterium]|nr:TetR/AcrR family transcriptional regulator [Solirubrobacteraceae bacterium]